MLCTRSMEHFKRLPVGSLPLLAASLVTALPTYFLGCQVLLCRGGSHGDTFPYCRNTPTARLSWWWLRLCLETPSHPQTLCCRLPTERESPPANPARRLAPRLPNAERPPGRTARPVRLSRSEDRWARSPAEDAAGPGAPGRERVPHAAAAGGGAGGWRAAGEPRIETWAAFPAPPCWTPAQNGSETWTSISSCRRFTLWTQFPPKTLSAGISAPRFQWQEGGLSQLGTQGRRRVLGALSSWEKTGWVFSWRNCTEVYTSRGR